MNNRALASVFRNQKSIATPFHLVNTARIGVRNRYKYVSLFLLLTSVYRITRAKMSTFRET